VTGLDAVGGLLDVLAARAFTLGWRMLRGDIRASPTGPQFHRARTRCHLVGDVAGGFGARVPSSHLRGLPHRKC